MGTRYTRMIFGHWDDGAAVAQATVHHVTLHVCHCQTVPLQCHHVTAMQSAKHSV
eukprot:m.64906 g.64906  ORF g.64906 m.64906 type:complete len:55 (+) comp17927_c0_seq2:151-315(+)